MALANLYRVTQDLEGNVVTGVLGTVLLTGTSTLAALFADAAGTIPLPNPTTNNAQYGSFDLFMDAGTYDMQFVKAGFTFEPQTTISLRNPDAGVNQILGTANRILVSPALGIGFVTLSTPQDLAPDSSLQFAHLGLGIPPGAQALIVSGTSQFTGALTGTTIALTGTLEVGGQTALYQSLGIGGLAPVGTGHLQVAGVMGLGGKPVDPTVTLAILHHKPGRFGITMQASVADVGNQGVVFLNMAGTFVGSIDYSATATSYNTSSDARLKYDVEDLTGALDVIRRTRPVTHLWHADGSRGYGFLAHELQQVVPNAVSGEPDAVHEDGSIKPQQVDYARLVVWLVAAVQELAAGGLPREAGSGPELEDGLRRLA